MNKDEILKRVTEHQIFTRYAGPMKLKKLYRSPLRKENTPSFHIIEYKGHLFFKDFGTGESGDCFKFVMLLYKMSFGEAVKAIAEDFNLIMHSIPFQRNNNLYLSKLNYPSTFNNEKSEFEYYDKGFSYEEIRYWESYGIGEKILKEYNVISCQWVKEKSWKDNIISTPNCPIFCYKYESGNLRFYRPMAFNRKFFGNSNANDIFGYPQAFADETVLKLYLCAGQKDTMSVYANTGNRAVCLNSESAILTKEVYEKLNNLANQLVACYDMDETGRKNSAKIVEEYGVRDAMVHYKLEGKEKDISDYFKRYHKENETVII
jgi:CHC2 zinc finger/Toprim-like